MADTSQNTLQNMLVYVPDDYISAFRTPWKPDS